MLVLSLERLKVLEALLGLSDHKILIVVLRSRLGHYLFQGLHLTLGLPTLGFRLFLFDEAGLGLDADDLRLRSCDFFGLLG